MIRRHHYPDGFRVIAWQHHPDRHINAALPWQSRESAFPFHYRFRNLGGDPRCICSEGLARVTLDEAFNHAAMRNAPGMGSGGRAFIRRVCSPATDLMASTLESTSRAIRIISVLRASPGRSDAYRCGRNLDAKLIFQHPNATHDPRLEVYNPQPR